MGTVISQASHFLVTREFIENSMMEITLILVRHGQASHNVKGSEVIFNFKEEGENRVLDTDLTETGRQQAQKVAERLSQKKIDLAISSDLRRALDTALAVASRHNNIQVHTWKSARERNCGCFEKNPQMTPRRRELLSSQMLVEDSIELWTPPSLWQVVTTISRSTLGNLLARETADALRKIPR